MNETTRIAVLGTLAEFGADPLPYDMQALVDQVVEVHPDLLCLEISPKRWQARDFGGLPPEYREALLPLADQSDIVVVPVGGKELEEPTASRSGWRDQVISWLRDRLTGLQRSAPGLDAINRGWRHDLGNFIYYMIAELGAGDIKSQRGQMLATLRNQVVQTARRDPGARILVVVNIQYCHRLRPELRQQADIEVVRYQEL
jgi:hypothetical protein